MKILKFIGVLVVIFIIAQIIFYTKYWVGASMDRASGENNSIFIWEDNKKGDSLCFKQYFGLRINGKVILRILHGKTTSCV